MEDAVATFERNIETQTGRSVSGWVALVRAENLEKHGQMVAWMKSAHGLSHGYAKPDRQARAGGGRSALGQRSRRRPF
ncbi:DUF4287 domain-containing protein [Rugamonas sp.]|uniref:DUF4287 domain-containing protein n=1 Tax=Rugamonas sp. TaxID=1926287 RepID=UPI0025D1A2B4|nr:DUF4287 domain-containing protein [Rugamonas sp.]